MRAVYTDLHIHTSDNADIINEQYNSSLLVRKVKEFSNADSILLSLTDHNTINKKAYESLLCEDVDVLLGVELHIRNYENCKPYHCHVFFDVDRCEIINRIDAINSILLFSVGASLRCTVIARIACSAFSKPLSCNTPRSSICLNPA